MNTTRSIFCRNAALLVLIIFISCFTVSYSLPAAELFVDGSKDLISNNTDGSCVKLLSTSDKFVKYKCNGEYSEYCTFGKTVPEYTVVKTYCNPGYYSLNNDGNETTSVCVENKWIPANVRCHKTCDRLYSGNMNVNLECFHENVSIPCGENSLTPGTTIRSSCKDAHKYEKHKSTRQEIHCTEDGKWDADLIPCISGCEKIQKNIYTEAPWHVTILYVNKRTVGTVHGCSGTIISPRLILTVESCIYKSATELKGDPNVSKYGVLVSKVILYQRLYEVAEFRYFNQTKFTHKVNRSHIPMLVVLREKMEFNVLVSPAHIQWESPNRMDMKHETVKISGNLDSALGLDHFTRIFGMPPDIVDLTDVLTGIPTSKMANFSSHNACKERWTYPFFASYWGSFLANETQDIKETFLYDKNLMCVEYEDDLIYDVGSGVIVEENNCDFVRGIMGPRVDVSKFIANIDKTIWSKEKASAICDDSVHLKSSKLDENIKFWCEIRNRMKNSTETIGKHPGKPIKFSGSIDIADYVGWIKKVRDEIESR